MVFSSIVLNGVPNLLLNLKMYNNNVSNHDNKYIRYIYSNHFFILEINSYYNLSYSFSATTKKNQDGLVAKI